MPGVLMLESMIQTAAWLVRLKTDFRASVVRAREVRNVRYSRFVSPGETLEVTASLVSAEGGTFKFKGEGRVAGELRASARLELVAYNLADESASGDLMRATDEYMIQKMRARWRVLGGPEAAEAGRVAAT
jgi:3-hydroxyacyl-[acyl-carrier-protein] dehydratase